MKIRIKTVLLICLVLLMPFQIVADSLTLSTAISSVANGVNGIGMGLFPVSMTYSHGKSFQLIPDYANKASFSGVFSYSLANSSMDGNYDYLDGTPKWAYNYKEVKDFNFKSARSPEQHSRVLTGISSVLKKSTVFFQSLLNHSILSSGSQITTISCFSNWWIR